MNYLGKLAMKKIFQTMGIRLFLSIMLLVVCSFAPGPALAGSSWMDQGKSLLKNLGTDSGGTTGSSVSDLTTSEIIAGLKQALEKGSQAVVSQLGAENGFFSDTQIHIPLPENLSRVKSLLDKAGMGAYTDDVELKLNRAAEAAAPKAKALFVDAISQMKMEDARAILDGPDDAATSYFRDKMSDGLVKEMSPVIDNTLETVGAVKAYDTMMGKYKSLPLVPDVKGNLTAYTAGKAVDGIFYYLAQEEKAIRENPAKRTTELLQKVFN